MDVEYADLTCAACGRSCEHELRHVGRLLHSTMCTSCGHVVEMPSRTLLRAYVHDLEQRVASKPSRLARRARQDPWQFVSELPTALLRQPAKLAGELWELVRGR
ncbi:MAG: hypothetical protein M3P89_06850 [Actinomycetota bacterium]|nr:hypothetical protein [Actinomycetota bacterium]MDP9459319.1 hypothetical protein [Actinomycetota bacterium]